MDYKKLLPKRKQKSHKGTFGKILNIAGSINFQGAGYLSSISALKIGAGYVMLACDENIVDSIASLSPDITFLPLANSISEKLTLIEQNLHKFNVISMGCGLGSQKRTIYFIEKMISSLCKHNLPVILDADALNAISFSKIKTLPCNTVITPHEAEMARLMNVNAEDVSNNRIFFAKEASKKFNCITVLKGHETIITSPINEIIINKTGNSALAKAGSGDVLTGIISGLAAQGCTPFEAAVLGTYIHGLCAEIAAKEMTEYSVLASNLLRFIPNAVTKILQTSNFND